MSSRFAPHALALVAALSFGSSALAQSAAAPDAGAGEGPVAGSTAALQGRSSAATSSACASCTTVGSRAGAPPALFASLALLGALAARRRS